MDILSSALPGAEPAPAPSSQQLAELLLDALKRRDFDAVQALFAADIRFRGLIPSGPFELTGAAAAANRFRAWFGGDHDFELVEGSVAQVGERIHLYWRVRMNPPGREDAGRIAEQHLFATAADRITAVELLCSGFQGDAR